MAAAHAASLEALQSQLRERDKLVADLKKEVTTINGQLKIAAKTIEKTQKNLDSAKEKTDHVLDEKVTVLASTSELKKDVDKLRAQIRAQEKDMKLKDKALEEMNSKLEAEMFKHAKLAVELKARPTAHKLHITPSKDGTAAAAAAAVAASVASGGSSPAAGSSGAAAASQNATVLQLKKENDILLKQMQRTEKAMALSAKQLDVERDRRNKVVAEQTALAEQVKKLKQENYTLSLNVKRHVPGVSAIPKPTQLHPPPTTTATGIPPAPGTAAAAAAAAAKRPNTPSTPAAAAVAAPATVVKPSLIPAPGTVVRGTSGATAATATAATPATATPTTRPASASVVVQPTVAAAKPTDAKSPSAAVATPTAAAAGAGSVPASPLATTRTVSVHKSSIDESSGGALASFDLFNKRSHLATKFFHYRSLPMQRDVDILAVTPTTAGAVSTPGTAATDDKVPSASKPAVSLVTRTGVLPVVSGAAAGQQRQQNEQRHWLELAKHQLYERDRLINELAAQVKKLSAGLKFSLLARAAGVTGASALGGSVGLGATGGGVCNDITHLELVKNREDAEKALTASQEALAQLQKVMEKERSEYLSTEKNLRTEVLDLTRALEEAPKAAEVDALTDDVTALQKAVIDYQQKYEDAKRKNKELKRGAAGFGGDMSAGSGGAAGMSGDANFSYAHAMQQSKVSAKKGGKNAEAKLNEQLINLQYQIYYGASKKDDEISELKEKLKAAMQQLEVANNDNVEVAKLKHKFHQFKDKEIEDWLFAGDLAEAL